jgi:hypothetical protein
MKPSENYIRALTMGNPEWIPAQVVLTPPLWAFYREELEDLIIEHPTLFGKYDRGSRDFNDFGFRHKGNVAKDDWGCVWHFEMDGHAGVVKKHPLKRWEDFRSYKPPDPLKSKSCFKGNPTAPPDFEKARLKVQKSKTEGNLAWGSCPHGFMFQRLYYLRGFENLMIDLMTNRPELKELITMVLEYNMKMINEWLDIGVDIIGFGDDLGTQDRLPISPRIFHKYLFPTYQKMFGTLRNADTYVHLHSDGHIIEVAEDLVKAGVNSLNLQDLVNGIHNIKRKLKGRICIDIDIDRQKIIPFGKPNDIKKHIRNVIRTLNSPEGGLTVRAAVWPPSTLENIEALCQVLEDEGCGPKGNVT